MILVGLATLLSLLFAFICHQMAQKRGRSVPIWIALGVVLGPVAPVLLLVLGAKNRVDGVSPTNADR